MAKGKKDFNNKTKKNNPKKDGVKFVKNKKPPVDSTTKEMRSLYNKLMQINKNDKSPLVKKVINLMEDKYENYCYKHDGCRILQGCLKYGSKEQKKKIIDSLLPFLFKIICGKYSIYLSGKIFKYSDNEQKNKILEDIIKPNFKDLLKYSGGISFTKMIFTYSNQNYQDELIDLYIKDYFKIPLEKLKLIKESENNEKKNDNNDVEMEDNKDKKKKKEDNNIIIDNSQKSVEVEDLITRVKTHLDKQLEKEINKNFIFHGFLNKIFDYLDEKTQIYITELFDDDIGYFMDSNYGFELLMKMYSISSAKTRKRVIRFVRDNMDDYLNNDKGTCFIIKVILFTDDTVNINKTFMNSIIDKLNENIIENKNCLKIIWNILYPFNKKCNNVQQQSLLSYSTPNSNKKSLEKRQTELLANIFEKIFKIVNYDIKLFLKDLLYSNFLTDFMKYLITKNEIEKLETLTNTIIAYIEDDYKNNKDTIENCILADKIGHVTIKRILKELNEAKGEAKKYEMTLAEKIAHILKADMDKFLNLRAIFIIVQLMENENTKNLLNKELKKYKGEIMKNKDNDKLTGMKLLAKLIA
jgi:pumilio family protein 6